MPIEVTEEAIALLRRSLELGNIDRTTGGIRLRGARTLGGGFEVQVEFAAGASSGDATVREGDLNIFVDPAIVQAIPDALISVSPEHERIIVGARP